ncbi:hypothetical protein GGF46_000311 [Coemansia sp. RSA 552]|nr:hypothetical protein GGF46_000311 [Coemansia sp. RSA 552]
MFDFSETNITRDKLRDASAHDLRKHYAAKASINPGLGTPSVPPTISKVYEETVAEYKGDAEMAITEYQGVLQNFFVGLVGAKRILEIGTFTGTSTIFFANGLKRNGVVGGPDSEGNKPIIALDISEKASAIARKNFVEADVDDYIEVLVGDARESLVNLEGQQFDLVFIDADKSSYPAYYDAIIDRGLLSKGGLMVIDNTAFDWTTPFIALPGPVPSDAEPLDLPYSRHPECYDRGKGAHEFNEYIRNDPRSEVVLLPIITGITLVRLLSD